MPSVFLNRESVFDKRANEKAKVSVGGKTAMQRRILALLTGRAMSAKELAEELEIRPGNGSFRKNMRLLLQNRLIVFENPKIPRCRTQRYRISPEVKPGRPEPVAG